MQLSNNNANPITKSWDFRELEPDHQNQFGGKKRNQRLLTGQKKKLVIRSNYGGRNTTGEARFKKIKEGFLYFDFLDDVMGHRDRVDPSKMAIEESSMFASEDSSNTSPSPQLQESGNGTEENLDDDLQAATGMKQKATDKSVKSARKGKRRRDEQQTEWHTSFLQLMERSLEQDNIQFERSTEML